MYNKRKPKIKCNSSISTTVSKSKDLEPYVSDVISGMEQQ